MMNNKDSYGLSNNELSTISQVLAPYSEKIACVGIFGSRANGQYKSYSDIDLVLYGVLTQQETAELNTLFDESNLGLRVDLKNYSAIEQAPLLRHIDVCAKTLFTQEQLLLAMRKARERN